MSLSPARRHYLRVTAERAAAQDAERQAITQGNARDLMLAKLYADTQTLRGIQSTEAKIEKKRTLLPDYLPYIDGLLQDGVAPVPDDVLMSVMVWALDVADYPLALRIADHALAHNLPMPDRFKRNAATLLAEQVADAQLAATAKGETPNGELLVDVAAMVDGKDMPDQVRAKLFKALGQFYESSTDEPSALDCYTRAFELDNKVGVKKELERLQRKLGK